MKAVIYARYSTDMQNEQSIEGQIYVCEEYSRKNGITVISSYVDRAISGKTEKRPEFLRMIEDSNKKLFDYVLVYKLDRFSRDRYDSAIYKKKLRVNGVKVISATEAISDSPEGIILESLLEGMAEYYSAELSQKTLRGLKQSALKCKFTGGHVTLGYKINSNKGYEIDENNAKIIRFIFESYANGCSYNKIITELNTRGYKSAAGNNFGNNSLNSILSNEKYIGIYRFNNDVIIENGIPAIISEELFELVQAKMKQNKKAPARAKARIEYLLSVKIFCGKCGGAMVGQSTTSSRGYTTAYYECNVKKRLKTCDKKNIRKDWIEKLVIEETKKMLTDKNIDFIAENVIRIVNSEKENQGVIKEINAKLREVEIRLKNISNAIAQGIISDTTKTMLLEAEEEKIFLSGRIQQEQVISKTVITKPELVFWLESFRDGTINDDSFCRKLIDTFVHSVYVFDDKLVVTYNTSDKKAEISLTDINKNIENTGVQTSDIKGCVPPQY